MGKIKTQEQINTETDERLRRAEAEIEDLKKQILTIEKRTENCT